MVLLASFNYTEPSLGIQLAGAFIGAVLFVAIGIFGRVLFGILAGGLGAGTIAWFVLGAGRGDLTGLLMVFYSPIIGLAGAVLGGIVAALGRAWRAWASGSRFADVPLGVCAGVVGAGAIAWFVLGAGSSRLNELEWWIDAPIFGVAGAGLGGIVAWLEKEWRMMRVAKSKRSAPRSSLDNLDA
jgi:hypothetical protein